MAAPLFYVSCTTCQARIKVCKEKVIGEIHGCPKCGGMVQIAPPAGWKPPSTRADPKTPKPKPAAKKRPASPPAHSPANGRQSAASRSSTAPAARRSSEKAGDRLSPHADENQFRATPAGRRQAATAAALAATPDRSRQGQPLAGETAPDASNAAPLDRPPVENVLAATTSPDDSGLDLSSGSWTSPTEQMWHRFLLWGSVGGVILFGTGVMTAYWILRPEPDIGANRPVASAAESADRPTADAQQMPLVDDQDAGPEAVDWPEDAPVTVQDVADNDTDHLPPVDAPIEPASDDNLPRVADRGGRPGKPRQQDEEPARPKPGALASVGRDPVLTPAFGPAADDVPRIEDPLAHIENAPVDPVDRTKLDPAQPEEPSRDAAVRRIAPQGPAEPLNVDDVLAKDVMSIRFSGAPLDRFLDFVSDMTRVPISLDMAGFQAAGIATDVPISVAKQKSSIAEVLAEALSAQRLTYLMRDDHLIVTPRATASTAQREIPVSVGDLLVGDMGIDRVADLIRRMVSPQSWDRYGGRGELAIDGVKLAVTHDATRLTATIVFCEKLREARNIPRRTTISNQRIQFEPRHRLVSQPLAEPVLATFHEPTRLVDVLDYLETVAGIRLHVDWTSAAREQIAPDTLITCSLPEQPSADLLHELLTPLGLAWRLVADGSIEIFSRQDAAGRAYVEFYDLSPHANSPESADRLVVDLRRQIHGQFPLAEPDPIYYDQASRHLIARLSTRAHLELERLIKSAMR